LATRRARTGPQQRGEPEAIRGCDRVRLHLRLRLLAARRLPAPTLVWRTRRVGGLARARGSPAPARRRRPRLLGGVRGYEPLPPRSLPGGERLVAAHPSRPPALTSAASQVPGAAAGVRFQRHACG